MFPQHILPKLSPNAAKLYLTLMSLIDPARHSPRVYASMDLLTRLTALSERACSRAIQELKKLHLLAVPPHRYHAAASYVFLPPPDAPATKTCPPPEATMKPPIETCPPPEATMSPRNPQPTPISSSKTQCPPPQAALLTTSPTRHMPASPGGHVPNPSTRAKLNRLLAQVAQSAGSAL